MIERELASTLLYAVAACVGIVLLLLLCGIELRWPKGGEADTRTKWQRVAAFLAISVDTFRRPLLGSLLCIGLGLAILALVVLSA